MFGSSVGTIEGLVARIENLKLITPTTILLAKSCGKE